LFQRQQWNPCQTANVLHGILILKFGAADRKHLLVSKVPTLVVFGPQRTQRNCEINPFALTNDGASDGNLDRIFVCGGYNVEVASRRTTVECIKKFARDGVPLGALCTGAYALAKAGVIDGYRCSVSWVNLASIREKFPRIQFTDEIFTLDRGLMTCASGTASIDLMLTLIRQSHGAKLASEVSSQFNVERIRTPSDRQTVSLVTQIGFKHRALLQAASWMEQHLEEPLPLEHIALRMNISLRQLERIFQRYLSVSPRQHYTSLRLERAHQLLQQTDMSVTDVAVACGFLSASQLGKVYRKVFGCTPSDNRLTAKEAQ